MSSLSSNQKKDHRVLNKDLEIFYLSEELGAGFPFWAPRGMALRGELEQWLRELEDEAGYLRLQSPPLAPESLYRQSGHLAAYADGLFPAMDGRRLRPMNCPHHHLFFRSRPRSEKELPYRLAEFGQVFREEPSGALLGLNRARCFCQNDAHIYILREQAIEELRRVIALHRAIYAKLGWNDVRWRLSLSRAGDAKFAPAPEQWSQAEEMLRSALRAEGLEFFEAPGEAAFYGPKIDVQMRSARGVEESVASVQLDFLAAHNFDLGVVRSGGHREKVWVIHRAPIGSFERFVAFLLERDDGWLPFWLSPEHVAVVAVGEAHRERAREVGEALRRRGLRVDIDRRDESLSWKIREARRRRIPVVAVIGDREMRSGGVQVRERKGLDLAMSVADFVSRMEGRRRDRD